MSKPFSITPVYDLLLRGSSTTPVGLYQLQIATAAQLTRLHYSPGSIKTVKARLKTLVDNGYIQADCIPTKLFRSPYYYSLGSKGAQYLEAAGIQVNESFRPSKETNKHALFIEHTLELNDLIITASLLRRTSQRCFLSGFIHERVLKRMAYNASWKEGSHTQHVSVVPDAFLDFRLQLPDGQQRRLPLLLEHDRGSEEQRYFRRRIRAYCLFLKSGEFQKLFATRTITVGFTTFVGQKRLEQMRDWTRAELTATSDLTTIGGVFIFACLSPSLDPRQVWQEPQWYGLQANTAPFALLADA